MEIFFIVISIFVLILTINISVFIYVDYDFYKNIGYFRLKIFNITILNFQISLIAGYFNLIRRGKKVVQIKIDFNDENFKFVGDVGEYFLKKIYLINAKYRFKIYGTEPFLTAILSGNVMLIEGVLRSLIISKSPSTDIECNIDVGYVDNILKFSVGSSVLITAFDFLWAILRAVVKRSMYGKKARLRGKC